MFQNDNSPSDSIPSFLLKTYEILEVVWLSLRTKNTLISSAGLEVAKAL